MSAGSFEAYESIRKPEHSTAGDAARRFNRDRDAFTAGAQYALDHLLFRVEDLFRPVVLEGIETIAASVLSSVHDGNLT